MVRSSQPGRFHCVSGCAERVGAHVRDAGSLSRRTGGRDRRRRTHRFRRSASNEPLADLSSGSKLTMSKRPSTSDGITWPAVCWSLRLEQDQDSFSTVRRPPCDDAAISFAQ